MLPQFRPPDLRGGDRRHHAEVPAAPVLALGAAGGVPGSLGVVEGDGRIPYTPAARAIKDENAANWIDRDPELKCYLPGIPRAMYMPYPFQIVQSTNKVQMAFAFTSTARTIHLDDVELPPDWTYMGHSVGRWEGDTLVVDVTEFNGRNCFDRAGNFHSEALRLEERFTPISPDAIHYEVTITDPNTFTEPWTISMPLYRRLEDNMQVLEYRCIEFVEEFIYGHVRKEQLVTTWEGETIIVFRARGQFSSGVVEGFNGKARVITKRAYGFRTAGALEVALYHALGDLPEPELTHRFC